MFQAHVSNLCKNAFLVSYKTRTKRKGQQTGKRAPSFLTNFFSVVPSSLISSSGNLRKLDKQKLSKIRMVCLLESEILSWLSSCHENDPSQKLAKIFGRDSVTPTLQHTYKIFIKYIMASY